ncbi:MAG: hypothetical protein JNL10_02440 [Verrucomicrobiales bacterium]|nr:hypothetical protein [Verrucomicrobiales bacterium]
MIQQRPGDLLEVEFEGKFYYLVVLTRIALFGGNVVFAFHGDGSRHPRASLTPVSPGFNICTDLLLPKKKGTVQRLARIGELEPYWRTKLVKATNEHRPGHKASRWFIYHVEAYGEVIEDRTTMPPKYADAMDNGMHCFTLVTEMILSGYIPSKNPFL